MTTLTPTENQYLEVAKVLHWFRKVHLVLWFTGKASKRHKRTEYVLPRLVQKGVLKEVRFGKAKAYATSGVGNHIEHGLACSEALVRFILSQRDVLVIAEDYFKQGKFGCVPEWGIRYPNASMLLFEYCTKDNALRSGLVARKVNAYKQHLNKIEQFYRAKAVVVFAIDLPRQVVATLASPDEFCFFTDWQTFLRVPYGKQLTTPIYIWGGNGKSYALRRNG